MNLLCARGYSLRPELPISAGYLSFPCHSGLTPAQLPVPLSGYQGVVASDKEGLRDLYSRVAQASDSNVPEIDFAGFAAEVTAFEAEYRQNQTASVSPANIKDGIEVVRNP